MATKSQGHWSYDSTRRVIWIYLGILLAGACVLGIAHWYFADFKFGGVRWFNLDKERNVPTWFSGTLFFLMGCAAFVAFHWERTRNAEGAFFRLPVLWLGVGLVGFVMSLDEMTILHENLFWRETRLFSSEFNHAWRYVTQWQILFAPAIVLILGYFVLFFSNRFQISRSARLGAFLGIACWIVALLSEGVRGTFKEASRILYYHEVLIEELLEMMGGICLLAAIVFYTIDIALDFSQERRVRLQIGSRFFTKRSTLALAITIGALLLTGMTIYRFAHDQAKSGDPLPRLYRKALDSAP